MTDFECHITVPQSHAGVAHDVAQNRNWKTSEIARDPLLGDDTHFYLTCHSTDYDTIYAKMCQAVSDLQYADVPVLREKIEQIVHDVRH